RVLHARLEPGEAVGAVAARGRRQVVARVARSAGVQRDGATGHAALTRVARAVPVCVVVLGARQAHVLVGAEGLARGVLAGDEPEGEAARARRGAVPARVGLDNPCGVGTWLEA